MPSLQIDITLCHGSGNTFVMVGHPTELFTIPEPFLADFARKICAHALTVCDGLLIVEKDVTQRADSKMRMFNPDGSEAELCGNGMRCVAREVMQALGKEQVKIIASDKLYEAGKETELAPKVYTVSIDMGRPLFAPNKIPINHPNEVINQTVDVFGSQRLVSILAMPNPHVVAMIEGVKIPMTLLVQMGEIANDPATQFFPRGANVNFIQKLGDNDFFVATFERGAGLTKACGSGMTAASIVACLLGKASFDQELTIYNQGGYVRMRVTKDAAHLKASMTGNATYVMKTRVVYQPDAPLPQTFVAHHVLAEQENYQAVIAKKDHMLLKGAQNFGRA